MNNDSKNPANPLPTDTSGKPVNVVERDLQDRDDDTRAVDPRPSASRPAATPQKRRDRTQRGGWELISSAVKT